MCEFSLVDCAIGITHRVVQTKFILSDELYIKNVGFGIGDEVTVLRKCFLGKTLHIRTQHGAEFAIDFDLAKDIIVIPTRI